ncbi:hypothetical protein GGX14DRAFT_672488 [Mycena pura]|uniref:BTB domain-containing protein n=1 Tax=Mycena pura TaxID=153505 RepID=A0AAD6UWC2_9AGAR|nr:hypothetical protein GGX14DRAFT_672488 [Mycena pura]
MPDADIPPSSKRQRTDSDSATPISRSKIWMPGGDIILQTQSTQFRINSDILAQQSPIFRDMLSIPQPANKPTIDGCPIVHLSDAAKDWELLLETLYNPFQHKETLPFDVVAAMVRLGKKYEMAAIKNNATWRIHYEFPNTLHSWIEVQNKLTKIESQPGMMLDLLNLVYEYEIRSSVPTLAFNCLDMMSLEHLMKDETRRPDGSCVHLAPHIKLTLAIAVERIANQQRTSFQWLDDDTILPHPQCNSRTECTEQRQELYRTVMWGLEEYHYHCFDPWNDFDGTKGLCRKCNLVGEGTFKDTASKMWEFLPSFFQLPQWGDLKDLE